MSSGDELARAIGTSPFLPPSIPREFAMGLSASPELRRSLGWGAAASGILLLAWAAAALLNWAWWRPRRLDRALRAQGLRGTPYRFLRGDLAAEARLSAEARSKPMLLSHDIVPRVFPLYHRAREQFGRTFFTWLGPLPRVTITDPEMVRQILSNKFGHFGRPRIHPLVRLLSTGVFSYDGEKWAKHRRILKPAFHAEKLKRILPVFSACCSNLVDRWENLVGLEGYYELDVWPELQSFTGDVISRAAFGSSYEEGRQIFQLQAQLAELILGVIQTVYIPGYRFLPTPKNKRIKAIDQEIRTLLRCILKKREDATKMGETSNDDLLGLLMESNKSHFHEHGNAGMTTEEVIEECKLFYFAGHETTSVLLTWTMVVLSMHPDWQVRAREEVLQVFGKGNPDLDGLSHLKIVTMILYEVLRLYPPVYQVQRRTLKTMKIGNIIYPPGLVLAMPVVIIHHDQHLWGKDANEFNPERFADGIAKASKDQFSFFPFGGGPRICIGQNFALLEAKIGLSMILQRFSFELSPSYAHAPRLVVTLQPQHGAQLRLTKL
ncbi:Cytochrome P450 [Canna indica]|uniref:Cytochrome P450 n=1 Tax=Canna indica TaxID=4628 RepID=A0AAQ3L1U6_9LILI|nr:Cytochrome P450 [Canna indica]